MARQLVSAMTAEFDPSQYKDEYRDALMQVIESKIEGHEVKTPEPAEDTGKLVDLMAALEASVNAAKAARAGEKPVSVAEAKKAREGKAAEKPAARKRAAPRRGRGRGRERRAEAEAQDRLTGGGDAARRSTTASATSAKTPEPAGTVARARRHAAAFVIQRHRATRLHYDFRLEIGGVLVSWAVPKGLTQDPAVRRMAVHVEDHPIEYFDFEGVIPAKQYGAGDVIVWDWGTWEPEAETPDPAKAIDDGELKFVLHGQKNRGRFTIVRTSRRPGSAPSAAFEDDSEQWLLIKKRDADAVAGWDAEDHPQSVKTGRTNDEVQANRDAIWVSEQPAAVARDRPRRRGRAGDARPDRADARDARLEAVQRPGLAVRDQVGRLPARSPSSATGRSSSGRGA